MSDSGTISNDTDSDEALVARLYDLTRTDDQAERARIDAMVYERLLQAYGDDDQTPAA